MGEHGDLLTSIADIIRDYRAGEIPEPTPDHVDEWIRQFDDDVQVPILRELNHVFKRTYVSKAKARELFREVVDHYSCEFWRSANLLDIQEQGKSQSEIRELVASLIQEKCGTEIDYLGIDGGDFVYLDDAIFTGERVIRDLSDWMRASAPQGARVRLMTIASHAYGKYQIDRGNESFSDLKKLKQIYLQIAGFREYVFENRRVHRDQSDVLWPTDELYDSAPFQPRTARQQVGRVYSSEEGRQLLEREFLQAGHRIRGFANDPNPRLKPLGFSPFEPGFGSLFVTFRNCPNNSPLALWYGDPYSYPENHPLVLQRQLA